MSTDATSAMRDFMLLVEAYAKDSEVAPVAPPLTEAIEAGTGVDTPVEARLLTETRDLIFKLRAHTETGPNGENSNDERALGIEQGFACAADMLENLLRRYEKD